jgi:hypothetical protein
VLLQHNHANQFSLSGQTQLLDYDALLFLLVKYDEVKSVPESPIIYRNNSSKQMAEERKLVI